MKCALYLTSSILCGAVLAAMAQGGEKEKPNSTPAGTGRVSPGLYNELNDQGEVNPVSLVQIQEVTPNIVEVRGANGWVVFASYDEAKKEYRGFFEWQRFGEHRSPGGKWADLYQVRLVAQGGRQFHMTGKSTANDFIIRGKRRP
jgi:hypothetical protein